MYVRSLSIHGLADLPSFRAEDLGRQVVITGPSPAASAVGDGLALFFSALSERALSHLLLRWGLIQAPAEAEIAMEGVPIQATWTDRRIAKSIVADHGSRTVRARAELLLDPPMSTNLRNHAAREPRLAVGLEGAPVSASKSAPSSGPPGMSLHLRSVRRHRRRALSSSHQRTCRALLAAQDTRRAICLSRRDAGSRRQGTGGLGLALPERHAPVGMWEQLTPASLALFAWRNWTLVAQSSSGTIARLHVMAPSPFEPSSSRYRPP